MCVCVCVCVYMYVYNVVQHVRIHMYAYTCTYTHVRTIHVRIHMYTPSQDSWTSGQSPFLSLLQPWTWLPMATGILIIAVINLNQCMFNTL